MRHPMKSITCVVLAGWVFGGCGGTFDAREAFIDCSSVTVTDLGTIHTDYDTKGWVVSEEVRIGEQSAVVDTEYERIAGKVRTAALAVSDGPNVIVSYDAHEHIEAIETEGAETLECANTHDGDLLLESQCGEVRTTYDLCEHPVAIDGDIEESIRNTIDACTLLGVLAVGEDSLGSYSRATAFQGGRPVGEVTVREGVSAVGTVTTWDCPEL